MMIKPIIMSDTPMAFVFFISRSLLIVVLYVLYIATFLTLINNTFARQVVIVEIEG